MPAAAKETALDGLISGALKFTQMAQVVDQTLNQLDAKGGHIDDTMTLDNVLHVDHLARKTAQQIIGSDREAYTADNQKNTYKSEEGLQFMCTPWITGKKWFIVDPMMMKDGGVANWYMRKDPRSFEYQDDFDTEVGKYKSTGRWSNGVDSPFFLFGHNAT